MLKTIISYVRKDRFCHIAIQIKKVKRGYIRSPEDSFVNSVNILEYVLNLEEEEV